VLPALPSLSLGLADNSTTAVNPLAGLLSGGFTFAPVNSFGGRGNVVTSTPTTTATQTPTVAPNIAPAAVSSPLTPFADGMNGVRPATGLRPDRPAESLAIPIAIGAGLLLVALALKRR